MTRDEVKAMLIRQAYEAMPELKGVKIDADKPYKEMGIDSLALVQILTAATKEMKVQLPGDQLASINSLNGLADLLLKAKGA